MMGDELSTDHLWAGYQEGIFPMTTTGEEIEWFFAHHRALFDISGVRVSKSLAKTLRQQNFEVTFNTCFEDVVRHCLRPTGNWISEHFVRAYGQAHVEGWAHSCEVWRAGNLVGGVYGIAIGRYFAAESMFHRERDMSKVALKMMIDECRSQGITLFDAQVMNPHLKSLGAFTVPTRTFKKLLRDAVREPCVWGERRPKDIKNGQSD